MNIGLFYKLEKVLYNDLSEDLRDKLIQIAHGKTLNELSIELKNFDNNELRNFLAIYILYQLQVGKPQMSNIIYITQSNEVFRDNSELKEKWYAVLDSVLWNYVAEVDSLENLYKLAIIAKEINNCNKNLVESYICIENQAISMYYSYFIRLMEKPNEEDVIEGARYLKKLSKLGVDVKMTAQIFNGFVIEFIETRNEFTKKKDYTMKKNIGNDLKTIKYMQKVQMESEYENKRLEVCKIELLKILRRKYAKIKNIHEIRNKLKELKPNQMKEFIVLQQADLKDYSWSISKGKYSSNDVIIKKYTIKDNLDTPALKKIEELLYNEIKNHSFITQIFIQISDSGKNLIKFLGFSKTSTEFTLVYKHFGDLLLYTIKKNFHLGTQMNLIKIVIQMLDAFADLENYKIFHQNISLNSFLIDEYSNIQIKNFGFELKNLEDFIEGDENREKYYRLVREDEPGKQDVFALGLVILQIYRSKLINSKKICYSFLKKKINKIREEWIIHLLEKMLNFDPGERLNFSNLVQFLKSDQTVTNSVPSENWSDAGTFTRLDGLYY